jgi:hypothetical protein
VDAHNIAVGRVGRPVVADSHQFDEEQDPDPDPQHSEKSDSDTH